MRERVPLGLAMATVVLLLLGTSGLALGESSSGGQAQLGGGFPSTSWALGVVVPEGSGLQGGGSLRWQEATNVTALVTLPDISSPDRIVYVVMSLMAQDGSVMQASAGVYPNSSVWMAYSWFIPNALSVPLTYLWLLNSSGPQMVPGAQVSISILRSDGTWGLKILDMGTGGSVFRSFPATVSPSLKAGDQEVFALESYSRAEGTFQRMGNLTLSSLEVDGQKVIGGFYTYGDWQPNHEPLFEVGSAGSSPPPFVSLVEGVDGSFVWTYTAVWATLGSWYPWAFGVGSLSLLLLGSISVVVLVYAMTRRRTDQKSRTSPES